MKRTVISIAAGRLNALVSVQASVRGLVMFSGPEGRSMESAVCLDAAARLTDLGFAVCLADLLGQHEGPGRAQAPIAGLLANRLVVSLRRMQDRYSLKQTPAMVFAAGSGADPAVKAAGKLGTDLSALVCAGGQFGAERGASEAACAVLLIADANDRQVIEQNQAMMRRLQTQAELRILRTERSLLSDPANFSGISEAAGRWFTRHRHYMAEGPAWPAPHCLYRFVRNIEEARL